MSNATGDAPAATPAVFMARGLPVMLDAAVAAAFEVDTREVNQAVARNPEKFGDRHCFRLSRDELAALRSQGVISKPKGRGGSQHPPMVYSQKGVARLATVLSAPKALEATDLIIDIFTEVYQQIAQGVRAPAVSSPSRLAPPVEDEGRIRKLRRTLLDALENLLSTSIDAERKVTVRDELSDTATSALADLKARLKTRGLENDKIAAETLLILQEVASLREKTASDVRRADAEIEAIQLDNLDKKIAIVERALATLDRLEPSAITQLYKSFIGAGALPAPLDDQGDDDA